MLGEQANNTQPFPATEEEVEKLVTQVINFVHDKAVMDSVMKVFSSGRDRLQEAIAQIATGMVIKVVAEIEDQTSRDILPDTELGILSMIIEELYTVATNYGNKVSPEEVQNTIQIASSMYNQALKQQPAMQGGQQGQGQAQGQPMQQRQQGQGQAQGQPQQSMQQGPPQAQGQPTALGGM